MKRALFVLAFCAFSAAAFAQESEPPSPAAAPEPTPPSDQRGVNQLVTRVRELQRQLDESLEARLKDRAQFDSELEKARAAAKECAKPVEARKAPAQRLPVAAPAAPAAPPEPAAEERAKAERPAPAEDSSSEPVHDRRFAGGKTITPGALVAVHVENMDEMNVQVAVANDGTINLPLLGRVPAAGRTDRELADDLEHRLTQYLVKPKAVVTLR